MRQFAKKCLFSSIVAVAFIVQSATRANATVSLAVGATDTGITADVNTEPGGSTLLSGPLTVTGSTSDSGSISLKEEVWKNGGTTDDFLLQLTNTGSNTIKDFAINSFTGFSTVVGYETVVPANFSAGTVGTSIVSRSADGSTVDFTFTSGLAPGAVSDVFVAQTNYANDKTTGFGFFNDAGGSGSLTGLYASAAGVAVPEPTSLSLLGIGGLALLRRRSRRAINGAQA